ncbi:MAG: KpsF/GutQ family sugar-phosphate isomerase [Nitrospinota bacterium]|nr:KpsF/GutQ family sugar-phosphate isomerase [Nitrospinota bacterium]
MMDPLERGKKTIEIEINALQNLPGRMGDDFVRAVELIIACKGHVVVTGIGKSGLIAQKISATFASTGTPSFFIHPVEGVHGDLGMVKDGDVVLALSFSGETEELLRVLPVFARLGMNMIAITGNENSTLAKQAVSVLDVSVEKEACPINLAPTASTTATLAMGDALAMSVLEGKGFRPEDFAQFHPGGILGRNLVKVEEVMCIGLEVPFVDEKESIEEVVKEMSLKKLGMACVVNQSRHLVGVITDGDLRRCLETKSDWTASCAKDLMSNVPHRISPKEMAAVALHQMESSSITSLVVCEADSDEVIGVIHLHHILKKGIV